MGCLEKFLGVIIAILIILVGITKGPIGPFVVAGIVYGILTFVINSGDFMSFTDELTETPLSGLVSKFILKAIITGVVFFLSFFIFGGKA